MATTALELRKKLNLSQTGMAYFAGVSLPQVGKVEQGKAFYSVKAIRRLVNLAAEKGITVTWNDFMEDTD
jgi:transcriptional regulator with XRE-family HTH domain